MIRITLLWTLATVLAMAPALLIMALAVFG
jgi:hypothetical protein